MQEANMEKEKGNECFRIGNYDMAIDHYTRGIMCDSTNAILPANRAMAFIKKQQFGAAEQDCDIALTIDPTYIKAYHRRGVARVGLAKLQLAREDFKRVLEAEPGNKQALQELNKLDALEKISSQRNVITPPVTLQTTGVNVDNSIPASLETINITSPLDKPAHLRSKKPMRRVPVLEVDGDESAVDGTGNLIKDGATVATSQKVPQKTATTALSPSTRPSSEVPPSTRPSSGVPPTRPGSEVPPSIRPGSEVPPLTRSGSEVPPSTRSGSEVPSLPVLTPTEPATVPAVPSSYYQFSADFRKLRAFPDKLYQYFKQISPSSYPKLFQQSLESDMFSAILSVYSDYYVKNGDNVLTALHWLSKTKRFNTLVLFTSQKDKEAIKALFDHLKSIQGTSNAELEELIIKYQS
jgi:hypothetical protein